MVTFIQIDNLQGAYKLSEDFVTP